MNKCPFCGSINVICCDRYFLTQRESSYAHCENCNAEGPSCATDELALDRFCNPPRLQERIEQLEAALVRACRPVPTRERVIAIIDEYARPISLDEIEGTDIAADAILALLGGSEE